MPDAIPIPSFEHALEADLQRLATEIRKGREHPELRNASEKELVKEAIRSFPELAPRSSQTPTAPPTLQPAHPQSPLPAYMQDAPAEVKLEIEYLMDLALRQGIGKALAESKKSPYFVQDAFHDTLAGRLYPILQKRGIIK
jgi:hypothetical protein